MSGICWMMQAMIGQSRSWNPDVWRELARLDPLFSAVSRGWQEVQIAWLSAFRRFCGQSHG
jgi:hypothetical protein